MIVQSLNWILEYVVCVHVRWLQPSQSHRLLAPPRHHDAVTGIGSLDDTIRALKGGGER